MHDDTRYGADVCVTMGLMCLSHQAMTIAGEAYEVGRHDLLRDARMAWTWQGPADDLVANVSHDHDWPAELTVSYLSALRHVRMSNRPDRGW